MNRGTRLIAFSSRLLHPDTFALMVAPAIADLQFESNGAGPAQTARGYAGVWRAVMGALCHDLAWAMTALVADDHRGVSLRADLATFGWLVLFQVGYFAGALTLAFGSWADVGDWLHGVFVGTSVAQALLLVSMALLIPALPVLACFWPARDVSAD
jgi:hypothetical protein